MDLSKEFFKQLRADILSNCNKPCKLSIISTSDDEASKIYINNKCKTCTEHGITTDVNYHRNTEFRELIDFIKWEGCDFDTDGIILQLPLNENLAFRQQNLIDKIPWFKDVDGLTTESIGRLWSNQPCLKPATARAVCKVIDGNYKDITGMKIAIINRSPLIGKPLMKMLLDRDAEVTMYHSKCENLQEAFDNNEIVITGTGCDLSKYFHDQCYWIDCGIIRENGKVHGDAGKLKSPKISPVPGGVGTLTTACLAENTVKASRRDFT